MADAATRLAAYISIVTGSIRKGLDPFAVSAVAQAEGLGGGIGDSGTSFGPFQLHVGGAFPSNVNGQDTSGWSANQRQSWAWSPQGIEYALNRISSVASGQKGDQAIASIVSRFERPADPGSEIQRAQGYYRSLYNASGGTPNGLVKALDNAYKEGGIAGTIGDVGAGIVGAPGAVAGAAGDVKGAVESVGSFLGKITDPDNLIRAGQLVAGAVLILLGVYLLARQVGLPAPPTPAPVRRAAGGVS